VVSLTNIGTASADLLTARVRKPEAEVAGSAFGQGSGEDRGLYVVVVMHFGRGLAGMGAEDATGVLDETALERARARAFAPMPPLRTTGS